MNGSLADQLRGVLDRTDLDLAAMTGSQAAELVAGLAEAESRIALVRLAAERQVSESGVWALDGSRSAAAWLSRVERRSKAAVGSDLKLARDLADHLPATSAAVRDGSVPVGHARVLARVCTRTKAMREMLPDADRGEALLLAQAGLDLADFTRFCNAWAYRVDPDAADAMYREADEDRFVRISPTTGGTKLDGFLSPVAGEGLLVALRAEIGVPTASDTRSHGQRMHDALESIANRALAGGGLGDHASVRPSVVVNVDFSTLQSLQTGPDSCGSDAPSLSLVPDPQLTGLPVFASRAPATLQQSGEIASGPALKRILCDSSMTRVVFGPRGEVLDVGRAQRTFTGPRRRALDAHDGGCMYPGCGAPPCQCEGHHTEPGGWAGGARTDARDGGILLCFHHHIHVHERDISIRRDDPGWWVFTDKHGLSLGATRPRSLSPGLWDPFNAV